MKLLKHMSELYDEELDRRSQELFDKNFIQLALGEQEKVHQYIHDISNPIWAPIFINGKKVEYEISNIGTVKNLKTGKLLSTYVADKNKYRYVSLTVNHVQYRKTIHRLVAIAFIPNPENKPEVNHINCKKWLNWVGNLEWNTRQENADNAVKDGLMLSGSKQPGSKFNEQDAHNVCKLAEQGLGYKKISEKLGISKSFVIGILFRNEWKEISKDYNLPDHKSFADEETIHSICILLQSGERICDICKQTGLDRSLVDSVKQGKAWRRISNNYDIPGLEKVNVRDKKSTKIYSLLNQGIMDTNEIISRLSLPDTKGTKKYIAKLRRKVRAKQVESSTTIESTTSNDVGK